jgi:hypothetical protein
MSSTQISLKKNLKTNNTDSFSLNKSLNKSMTQYDQSFDMSFSKKSYFKVKNNLLDLSTDRFNDSTDNNNNTTLSSKYLTIGNMAGQKIRQLVKKYF